MKILWFVDKQFDFALDRASWLETIKFLQRNNEVQLVTGYKRSKLHFPELDKEIIYIRSPKAKFINRFGFYLNQIRSFKGLVSRYRPNRIVFNSNNLMMLKFAPRIRSSYRCGLYFDVRTLPISSKKIDQYIEGVLFKLSLRTAAKHFDGIAYITDNIRKYCCENFNLSAHASAIWSSGVDTNVFRPISQRRPGGKFKILYHGTVAINRGLDKVIRALDLIGDSAVELIILGSGEGLDELKCLTARLKLGDRVVFRSSVPFSEVPEKISEADAGVIPFPDWVGWNVSSPIKLFEYLACGKPVIVTKIPAHLDVLGGQRFAFWADASTPRCIARAIVEAIHSQDAFPAIAEDARLFAKQYYSWQSQAEKLEKFLLGEKTG